MGLNPEEGPDFLAVYINDVLVFSRTLEDHLGHLAMVMDHLQEAGLKLKPKKCCFIRQCRVSQSPDHCIWSPTESYSGTSGRRVRYSR